MCVCSKEAYYWSFHQILMLMIIIRDYHYTSTLRRFPEPDLRIDNGGGGGGTRGGTNVSQCWPQSVYY